MRCGSVRLGSLTDPPVSFVCRRLFSLFQKLTQGAHKHVPRIAYNMFKKNWQKPEIKEGFSEIRMIDFQPHFDSTPAGEDAKRLFYQMS